MVKRDDGVHQSCDFQLANDHISNEVLAVLTNERVHHILAQDLARDDLMAFHSVTDLIGCSYDVLVLLSYSPVRDSKIGSAQFISRHQSSDTASSS